MYGPSRRSRCSRPNLRLSFGDCRACHDGAADMDLRRPKLDPEETSARTINCAAALSEHRLRDHVISCGGVSVPALGRVSGVAWNYSGNPALRSPSKKCSPSSACLNATARL